MRRRVEALLLPMALLLTAQAEPAPPAPPPGPAADEDAMHARIRERLRATPGPIRPGLPIPSGPRRPFGAPQPRLEEAGGRTVPLVADAVIARETRLVAPARAALAANVAVGPPFRMTFAAGLPVEVAEGEPGRERCFEPEPSPRDEAGLLYPEVCLIDGDRDSRYEVARFLPEAKGGAARDMPIAPAALRALPGVDEPGSLAFLTERRLRVAAMASGRAEIVLENKIAPSRFAEAGRWATLPRRPDYRADLPLRVGGEARLAGLTLRAEPDGAGGWRVRIEGRFSPWLTVSEDGNVIDAGSSQVRMN